MRKYHYQVTYKTHRLADDQTKPVKAVSATAVRRHAYDVLNAYTVSTINRINKPNKKS